MPNNLELKAHITSAPIAIKTAKKIKAKDKGVIYQRDIYFTVPKGRLKLRVIDNTSAELIFYERQNKRGSRYSNYVILPDCDKKLTQMLCKNAFGVKTIVVKRRHLFLYKNARIHIDKVKGVGAFIEFEVIVKENKRQAQKLMKLLIKEFDVKKYDVVASSYSDLILKYRQ